MNIQKMLKQAQEMQAKLAAVQAELDTKEFEGISGGGTVKVTLTGKGKMTRIAIDPSFLKAEEKDIVEDLIMIAHQDAKSKADEALADAMGALTGGLHLPAGMKLPF